VINEQTGSNSPRTVSLTVNALRLLVDASGSVIAGSTTAAVINVPTRNQGL
jgi:hypothetical protein